MADTNLNAFVNSCAGYVYTYILDPLAQGLAQKGVTREEMAAILQLPAARVAATPIVPTPATPGIAFGGAVPAMAQALAPTAARKNTATATPVQGRTCMYQFKRGEKRDMYCGKATAPGSDYCNGCLKTRKNLTKGIAAGSIPGAAPTAGAIPGMAGMPPGYAAPVPAAAAGGGAAQQGQLNVVPYDEARGLFREPSNGFIVQQVQDGVIAVLGRLDEAANKIVPLTPQEQVIAQGIGLVVNQTAALAAPAPAPAPIPAVPMAPAPAIPTAVIATAPTPMIPAIPTAAVIQPHLAGTGQPALPVIPPLAAPAAVPAMITSPVPQIPQIPQIPMVRA
jgi:Meckel syndrome type 1 protein